MAQSILGTVKGVFLDVETGGLDHLVHGITEVAMVSFEITIPVPGKQTANTRILSRFQTYVKPSKWLAYAPGALELQSRPGLPITLDFLEAHGISEEAVVRRVQRFLATEIYPDAKLWNAPIWAQSADFDHGFMSEMHKRVLQENPEIGRLFAPRCDWSCSRKMFTKLGAMIHKNSCQYGRVSQKHIMPFYGLEQAQTHTALQDCYDGVACLGKMFEDEANYYARLFEVLSK